MRKSIGDIVAKNMMEIRQSSEHLSLFGDKTLVKKASEADLFKLAACDKCDCKGKCDKDCPCKGKCLDCSSCSSGMLSSAKLQSFISVLNKISENLDLQGFEKSASSVLEVTEHMLGELRKKAKDEDEEDTPNWQIDIEDDELEMKDPDEFWKEMDLRSVPEVRKNELLLSDFSKSESDPESHAYNEEFDFESFLKDDDNDDPDFLDQEEFMDPDDPKDLESILDELDLEEVLESDENNAQDSDLFNNDRSILIKDIKSIVDDPALDIDILNECFAKLYNVIYPLKQESSGLPIESKVTKDNIKYDVRTGSYADFFMTLVYAHHYEGDRGTEVDSMQYDTAEKALKGHKKMVQKWSDSGDNNSTEDIGADSSDAIMRMIIEKNPELAEKLQKLLDAQLQEMEERFEFTPRAGPVSSDSYPELEGAMSVTEMPYTELPPSSYNERLPAPPQDLEAFKPDLELEENLFKAQESTMGEDHPEILSDESQPTIMPGRKANLTELEQFIAKYADDEIDNDIEAAEPQLALEDELTNILDDDFEDEEDYV